MPSNLKNIVEPVAFFAALLILWEILVRTTDIPNFILPPPVELYNAFVEKFSILMHHSLVTFIEAVGGFALSLVLGVGFAVSVVYSRHLQNTLYPTSPTSS